jgi:hypothetical protein
MAKRTKTAKRDEEILKHYTSYDEGDIPAAILKPAQVGALLSRPTPTFVKANISVDKTMNARKTAVIPNPPQEKKKR